MRRPSPRPTIQITLALCVGLLAAACNSEPPHDARALPILGNRDVGPEGDTLYHTVGDWTFYRQDSTVVTEDMLEGTPYVVDFFFTSCPTICPRVTANMLRVRDRFVEQSDTPLKLVSFTIDPKRDSVGHLADYAANLGIDDADDWWFVTGEKFDLYDIADDYFSIAKEDPDVPGGFDHSGRILLVDGRGRVRAYANGTDETDVDHFMEDVANFLATRDDVEG